MVVESPVVLICVVASVVDVRTVVDIRPVATKRSTTESVELVYGRLVDS
jgi:hypothetical protein